MIHILVTTILGFSALAATPKPLAWQTDYGKALTATRSNQRPLLVVLEAPNDSQENPHKNLLVEMQSRSELLKAYQRCHVDVTTNYGKKVAKAFGATKFPFMAIIDKTGSTILCKKLGQLSDREWNLTLTTYQKGVRVHTGILHTTFFRADGSLETADQDLASPAVMSPAN